MAISAVDPKPVLIDCDPGIDDALALLLAMSEPTHLDIVAITTVAGNVAAVQTERNARRMRDLAGRSEIAVFGGCRRPLLRPLQDAAHVHGETGMDGCGLAAPQGRPSQRHAVAAILSAVAKQPDQLTICAVGPLTNLAAAIVQRPDVMAQLKGIVLMGGAAAAGNVTAHAEFNFYVDPEAARIVFESGIPIVMHGLDVTHKARVDRPWVDQLLTVDTPVTRSVAGMLSVYNGGVDGDPRGRPVHDALAIAYLVHPEWFGGTDCHVAIETINLDQIGRSHVRAGADIGEEGANAQVIFEIDADRFRSYLAGQLQSL